MVAARRNDGVVLMRMWALAASVMATAPAPADPPCAGMVAEWRFNGTTADTGGVGKDGSLFEGGAYAAGVAGESLDFGAGGPFFQAPNLACLNPATALTVSVWYRPTVSFAGSGNDSILDKGATGHSPPYYQYHMGVVGDLYGFSPRSFGFGVAADGNFAGVGTPQHFWTLGTWYHLVGTYDGAELRLYVDGELVDANPASGAIPDYGSPVRIGRFVNLGLTLPGQVDEARIFNRALSEEEVRFLYRSPGAVPLVVVTAGALCPGSTATLEVRHLAGTGAAFQWRRETSPGSGVFVAIGDGPTASGSVISGSTLGTLMISGAATADTGRYDCIVTNDCGEATAMPGSLTIHALADVVSAAGTPPPDGRVAGEDFLAFLGAFFGGGLVADIVGLSGEPPLDGRLGGEDFLTFMAAFFGGC